MQRYHHFLFALLAFAFVSACVEDDDTVPSLAEVPAPSELSLDFVVANDNSGRVDILPGGRGVTLFTLDYGDGADAVEVSPGETASHTYAEGRYDVSLEAMGINGLTTTYVETLEFSLAAPENLVATVTPTPGNALGVDVTATADLESGFAVYFGEDDDAEPVTFNEGETVSHVYGAVGTYEVRVVALGGGSTVVEQRVTVTVSNPVLLPANFEEGGPEINFEAFGGATAAIVDNPDRGGGNESDRVVRQIKEEGSMVWAGSFFQVAQALDFSEMQRITIKSWAPEAGVPILLKLENATDSDVFVEVTMMTTVAEAWEELTFDLSETDLTRDYSKVVLFYNFGTAGTGAEYYFDDVRLGEAGDSGGGGGGDGGGTDVPINLPLDFENAEAAYTFSGFGGAGAEVIDNPDASGINASDRVVRIVKEVGSMVWGGASIDVSEAVDLSAGLTVTLKVWSPKAGAPILLKIENPDNGDEFVELQVPTTVSNTWEELTFTFPASALGNLRRIALFNDFGTSGTDEPYYLDDLRVVE